jgi:hypothetical protein
MMPDRKAQFCPYCGCGVVWRSCLWRCPDCRTVFPHRVHAPIAQGPEKESEETMTLEELLARPDVCDTEHHAWKSDGSASGEYHTVSARDKTGKWFAGKQQYAAEAEAVADVVRQLEERR